MDRDIENSMITESEHDKLYREQRDEYPDIGSSQVGGLYFHLLGNRIEEASEGKPLTLEEKERIRVEFDSEWNQRDQTENSDNLENSLMISTTGRNSGQMDAQIKKDIPPSALECEVNKAKRAQAKRATKREEYPTLTLANTTIAYGAANMIAWYITGSPVQSTEGQMGLLAASAGIVSGLGRNYAVPLLITTGAYLGVINTELADVSDAQGYVSALTRHKEAISSVIGAFAVGTLGGWLSRKLYRKI